MALEQLWNQYHSELFNFIRQRVNSIQDTEDILQDVFVKAQRHDCPSKVNPRAWLYRTARTTIIDYYRTRKSYEQLPETLVAQKEPDTSTLEMVIDCLREEAERLPEAYRDVLFAVDFEGQPQQQVSVVNDIPYATVRSRIRRARQQIKDSFENCCRVFFDYHHEEWNCEAKQPCSC